MWLLRSPSALKQASWLSIVRPLLSPTYAYMCSLRASFSCIILKIHVERFGHCCCDAGFPRLRRAVVISGWHSSKAQLTLTWGIDVPSKANHLFIRHYWEYCVIIITSVAEVAGGSFLSQTPGMSWSQLTLSVCYVDIQHFRILKEIPDFNQWWWRGAVILWSYDLM